MTNIVPFAGRQGGGGDGPEDPMLELRVSKVEEAVARVKGILVRLEPKITELFATAARQNDITSVKVEIAELKGRINSIPTWWMLLTAMIVTWAAGASIVFAIVRLST